MPRTIASLLVFATFIIAPLASSAAPITVPTGLPVGAKYRLAFVTSTTIDALSSDIADYNSFVTAVASGVGELAALGTTWKAIVSTATVDARDNTGTNPSSIGVPIYRTDDQLIAVDNADLWDGDIAVPLGTDESGGARGGKTWTGTRTDGTATPRVLGSGFTTQGRPTVADGQWVESENFPAVYEGAVFEYGIYAMSDVLTVVPEPGTMILAWIGATAVAGWQLRRHRDRKP